LRIDWRAVSGAALPILGTAVLACGLTLGVLKLGGLLPTRSIGGKLDGGQVVVFDIIKYTNAQRAVASKLLGGSEADRLDSGSLLLELSKRTRSAIEKIAGPHRVVLVKQAVIQGDAPDITDAVLADLGLPTNVATVSPSDALGDTAPTWLSLAIRHRDLQPRSAQANAAPSNSTVLP
jgi:hypothetical protein